MFDPVAAEWHHEAPIPTLRDHLAAAVVQGVLYAVGGRPLSTDANFDVAEAYDPQTRASAPDPEVEQLIADFARKKGIPQRKVTDQEILERCLYPMVNEGAKILEEGIAIRASDIDVVWVNGYGWPVYHGGPMFWGANVVGLGEVAAKIEHYHQTLGKPRGFELKHALYGKAYGDEEIVRALQDAGLSYRRLPEDQLLRRTAQDLADGRIVGWFQGRFEIGPRALGNRSILADPRRPDMRDVLNAKVKKRESFRPFAPAVLLERAGEPSTKE